MPQFARENLSPQSSAPLSFGQEQWWLMHQWEPDNATHNVLYATRWRGALDSGALEDALNELQNRHEVLRTAFAWHEGEPRQLIYPFQKQALEIIDLSHLPADERVLEAQRLSIECAGATFDLARPPLWKTWLLRLEQDDHVWVSVSHHIASDGWSLNLLIRELAALYNARVLHEEPPLSPLPLQYAEYAQRQRSADPKRIERQLEYWRKNLGGELSVQELPADHPRPRWRSWQATKYTQRLDDEAARGWDEMCRTLGVTTFMALLALSAAWTQKHTAQNDVVIGTALADRAQAQNRDMIGFLVNTLPLRVDAGADPTFRELCARARTTLLGAFSNAEVPFARMVEEITPQREGVRAELFQTLLVLLPPVDPHPMHGLQYETWELETGGAPCDLMLQVVRREPGFQVRWHYSTDLFDATTIQNMAARFEQLWRSAMQNPDARLSQLDWMPQAERTQLVRWSLGEEKNEGESAQGNQEYSALHQFVETSAAHTPDAVAIEDENGAALSTYADLNFRATQLAQHLQNLGIQNNDRVALWAARESAVLTALPAISRCGAACVPLDPAFPNARLQSILDDAAPRVLLAPREAAAQLAALVLGKAQILFLEDAFQNETASLNSTGASSTPVAPDATAYLLYTSGSTGIPKGVEMPQSALSNLVRWQITQSENDGLISPRTLHFAPLSFDVAWQEIFATWGAGATLVVASPETRRDPRALLGVLATHRIERLFLPFVALAQLAEAGAKCNDAELPRDLREVISAGEALIITPAIRSFFERLQRHAPATLHNHYGPTETHVATFFTLSDSPENWPDTPPIGRPIKDARAFVLDAERALSPIGVPGELALGGACVASGYWNNSEASAEKFVEIEISGQSQRVYLTGDIARWNARGELEYSGRRDAQIKVRGFRVEPGEIEAALLQHPEINGAAIVVENLNQEETSGSSDVRLTAYVVRHAASTLPASTLRRWLQERLPEYMIPAAIVTVEELPRTASGKIARRELPAFAPEENGENDASAPRDATEAQLTAIWERILNRKNVSLRDDFFDIGGHSLLAVRLLDEVESLTGRKLALALFFQTPTIQGQAEFLRREQKTESSSLVLLQEKGGAAPLFCIDGAARYRALAQHLGAEQPVYGLIPEAPTEGQWFAFTKIGERVAHYVNEIRRVQPHGPYYLAGLSFGGLVAFWVAQSLRARGERIALLALFDTYGPGYLTMSWRNRLSWHWKAWTSLEAEERAKYIGKRVSARLKKLSNTPEPAAPPDVEAIAAGEEDAWQIDILKRPLTTEERRALLAFVRHTRRHPESWHYDARMVVFTAQDKPREFLSADPMLGWSEFAPNIQIHRVPGTHVGILREPNVRVLACRLQEALREARREAAPDSP